ncbi:unnamed protein product [Closterium sp. Naga37s-1]|nr:unnamed protein product [Closterium sp. Naga37s-1]
MAAYRAAGAAEDVAARTSSTGRTAGVAQATAGAAETAVDRAAGTDGTSRIAREARVAGAAQATARAAETTAGVAQATVRAAETTARVAQAPAGMAGAADRAAEAAGRTLRAVSGGAGPVAEGAAPGLVGVVAEETGRAAAHQAAGDKAAAAAVVAAAEAAAVAGSSAVEAAAGGAVAEKGGVVGIAVEATAVVSAAGGSAARGRTAGTTTGERAGGAELGESVAGAGAPAAAGEGTAGAAAGEGTAEAAQTDEGAASAAAAGAAAEATEGTMARPAGAAEAAAGAVEAIAGPTEAVSGAEEAAERAGSKEPAGGAGSRDIGATGAGGVGGVPTRGVFGGGEVIVRDEDAIEDGMHIDGPLAQYLTPDGEADPAPLQPHDEVPPFPLMPNPMLADGPIEGLEENLRTEPLGGAPILTPHPPAHPPPPPGAPHPRPHPRGLPVASWGAAKALAFLAEPCSPTPTQCFGQPPPLPTTPDTTLADGPPGEHAGTARAEPPTLSPILASHPSSAPSSPLRAAHSRPHPQGLPLASRGAARALAFLAELCSATPNTIQSPPTSPLPPPPPGPPTPGAKHISEGGDDTVGAGPTGGASSGRGSGANLQHAGTTSEPHSPLNPPPSTTQPPQTSLPPPQTPRLNRYIAPALRPPPTTPAYSLPHHEWPRWAVIAPHIQPTTEASQPAPPSQPDRDNQNQVGRRRKKKGKGGKGPAHLLPPPSLPLQLPLLTPHRTEPAPGPTPVGQPPNSHPPPVPAPPQGHGSDPAHSPPGRLSLPLNPPQVAAAACAAGMEADGMRDAPMADATDSPSHASHPIHVDGPLPQPMVIGEGQGGFLGQARRPSPMETDLVPRPCHSHRDVVAPPPVQPVAVSQEGTSFRDEASAPAETPPPGVAEPPFGPHHADGQGHTTAHTSGSPPLPPSLASGPAAHGVPSTASSDATAPIYPTDTATSPDQVVRCPTCRSSIANRRALQHHTPFCHPADAARRAQALHDTSSVLPSLSEPQGTRTHFTYAQWQTLEYFDCVPDRLEKMGRVLPWLPRLRQPQTAARLLSACVSTRPQYLSRTVPPSPAVLSSFARWDARLGETFQQLLASGTWACCEDVRDAASDQIFLPIRLGGFGIRRMERIAPSFASGETEQIDPSLRTTLEGLPPDILSLLPPWPSCASTSPDSLFAGASRLLEAHALEAGQPVVGEGTRAGGPLEQRAEAGQPGGGAQWGQHQLRGRVARGAGGQRGRQGVQTSQGGEGGQQRQQQESQHRSQGQGAAPQGVGSGVGQGREQQRADGGTGGAGRLGGEVQGSHPLPPYAIRSPCPYPPCARSLAAPFDPPCPPVAVSHRPPFVPPHPCPPLVYLLLPLANLLHSLPLLNLHPAPHFSPPSAWFLPSLPLAAFLRSPPPPSPCPPTLPPLPLAFHLPAPRSPPPCAQLLPSLPLPPPCPAPHFPPPHARFLPSLHLPFFLRASPLFPPCPWPPMPLSMVSPLPAPRFFPP